MADQNPAKPFYSVLVLALVCSALVAGAAVGLRPLQKANRELDRRKNILYAAGLYQEGRTIDQLFAPIQTRIIELETGEFVPEDTVDPAGYQQLRAALSDDTGRSLAEEEDLARLRRLEKYSLVYLVREGNRLTGVILPVRGKGLWSTMYGYVALDADLTTIRGISFYEHGETPGLGGEIENRQWQQGWRNKRVYDPNDSRRLTVVKGKAATQGELAAYQIDGLSGATLTTKGVDNLMKFWFGDHGFKPFLDRLRKDRTDG